MRPKPKALVTGACGFVGRHLCKRLMDDGYYVVAIDNLSSESALEPDDWPAHLYVNDSIDFIFFNMSCQGFFEDDTEFFGRDPSWALIVHLAAIIGGRQTIEDDPLRVAAENLEIDSRFFRWVTSLKNKPGVVVYFSSSAAYPKDLQAVSKGGRLLKEKDGIELGVTSEVSEGLGIPDMTYGWAKMTGEYLAHIARSKYNIPIAIYRPFSGFGEDQAECYPFPSILHKVIKGGEVEIWSDGYRDFVYIDDMIDCVLSTMHKVAKEKTALNIASGRATSFSELARLIGKAMNKEVIVSVSKGLPKGVFFRVGDPTRALAYGWSPKISLEAAIERVVRYSMCHLELEL